MRENSQKDEGAGIQILSPRHEKDEEGRGVRDGGTEQRTVEVPSGFQNGGEAGGFGTRNGGPEGGGGGGENPSGEAGVTVRPALWVRLCAWANGWTARLVTVTVGGDEGECVWTGGPYGSESEAQLAAEGERLRRYSADYRRVLVSEAELARLRKLDNAVGAACRQAIRIAAEHDEEWRLLAATGGLDRRSWEAAADLRRAEIGALLAAFVGAL